MFQGRGGRGCGRRRDRASARSLGVNPELGLQRSFPRLQFSPPASAGLPQPVHPRPRARLSEAPPSRAGTPSWRSRDFNSTTSPPRAGTVGLRFHRAAQGGGPLPPSLAPAGPCGLSPRGREDRRGTDRGLGGQGQSCPGRACPLSPRAGGLHAEPGRPRPRGRAAAPGKPARSAFSKRCFCLAEREREAV